MIRCRSGFRVKIEKDIHNTIVKNGVVCKGNYVGYMVYCINTKYSSIAGWVSLTPIDETTFETHSTLKHIYHNKGLGKAMYAAAIRLAKRKGIRLQSSTKPSMQAQRVWRSLMKHYPIRERPDCQNCFEVA